MIGRKRKRLGDLLVDAGVVTSEQLGEALKKQRELGLKLGDTLIELKFTDENEIVEALHQQMGYPIAKIREAKIAPEVISLLPETIVRKHNVVPFEVDPDNPNILRVAMADPMDIIAIDDLAIVTNMQIEAMVATPSDVLELSAIMEMSRLPRWQKRIPKSAGSSRMPEKNRRKQTKKLIMRRLFYW